MSRLIEKLDDEEKLLPSDDGYCVYWAEGGYMTAENLREIASELDRRNAEWHKQVIKDVGNQEQPPSLCHAFLDYDGSIDLNSIAETEEDVKLRVLESSMGWKFEHPNLFNRDKEWGRLLQFGKVVPVEVTICPQVGEGNQ